MYSQDIKEQNGDLVSFVFGGSKIGIWLVRFQI